MFVKEDFVRDVLPVVEAACLARLRWFWDWQDRFQLARCHAWLAWRNEGEKGNKRPASMIAEYAVRRAAIGRDIPSEVRGGFTHGPDAMEKDLVHGGDMAGVQDRHDAFAWIEAEESWESWMKSLPNRRLRKIAKAFRKGINNTDACIRWKIGASRVSQLRRYLAESWLAWCER